jgi:hypothetical protein
VTQGQCDDSSLEEIIQNGKKWMSEEAMVAFEKYITRRDDLKVRTLFLSLSRFDYSDF